MKLYDKLIRDKIPEIINDKGKNYAIRIASDTEYKNMLRKKLLEDKKVTYASYFLGHPLLDKPKIVVKVNDGKPLEAIQRAAKALTKDYRDLREQFEKVSV